MKDKLLQIIHCYGVNNQLRKFNEEAFELIEAIMMLENYEILEHYKEYANDQNYQSTLSIKKADIAEEIADCYVMLEQFRLYYNISKEDVIENINYKINRQIDRIKKEDND